MEVIKIGEIEIDVRSENCLFVTIGNWVIYIDDSTGERIVNKWVKR